MITLIKYLNEARENKIPENKGYEWLYNTYKNLTNLTKAQVINGLSWMRDDLKVLQGFEKYLISVDTTKTAWTYMANEDDFLDKSKIDGIIERLADYLVEKK